SSSPVLGASPRSLMVFFKSSSRREVTWVMDALMESKVIPPVVSMENSWVKNEKEGGNNDEWPHGTVPPSGRAHRHCQYFTRSLASVQHCHQCGIVGRRHALRQLAAQPFLESRNAVER